MPGPEAAPVAPRATPVAAVGGQTAAEPQPALAAPAAGWAGIDKAATYAGLRQHLEFLAQTLAASWDASGGAALGAAALGAVSGDGFAGPGQSPKAAATSSSATGGTAGARPSVAQQIASGLQDAAGGDRLTLQLNPAELGEVEIQFLSKGDSLHVQITTTSREAESAVREGLQELKDSLSERGGRFQQVEVRVESKETQDHRQERRDGERREQPKDEGRSDGRSDQRGSGARSRSRQTDTQASAAQWANVFREVQ